MEQKRMNPVSREVVRAVLESRDHRHNETHAVLLAMFQSLVAELVEQGTLAPKPLAERLTRSRGEIAPDPHGAPARDMLTRVIGWLRAMTPELPPAHPERWHAPPPPALDET
jgi:hypothetical protein